MAKQTMAGTIMLLVTVCGWVQLGTGVQYVLQTVIQSLQWNPDRKFSYAEMVRVTFCDS
jgi:hypothetical protein